MHLLPFLSFPSLGLIILWRRVCASHVEGWIRGYSLHVSPRGLEKEEEDILIPDAWEVRGLFPRGC